jgi:orotidine-5'-phosphate decarboxylase
VPTEDTYQQIIWSADVPDDSTLHSTLTRIGHPIRVKIDRLYARRHGDAIFLDLAEKGYDVFNDAKLIEIPSKLAELAMEEIKRTRPWMLNCMAGALSNGDSYAPTRAELDGLKQFAEICLEHSVLPCAVTVLTSKKASVVANEFNGRSAIEQVLFYAHILARFGFTDMVCSPLEAAAIREVPELNGLNLNTPGVRMPSDVVGDQARVATPGQAIKDGVTRVVIGRPITNSDDPSGAVEAIAADIESAA